MNFDLDEGQQLARDTIGRFLGPVDISARHAIRKAKGGYSRARWQEIADLGLLALAAPEAMGGMGGTMVDLALVAEALGKGVAIDPWIENGVLPIRLAASGGRWRAGRRDARRDALRCGRLCRARPSV
jgi:alkylation response protein AidB-like acyl-CoA dehydrogenase